MRRIALPSISISSWRVSAVSAKALDSGELLNDLQNIDISLVCVALFFLPLLKCLLVCVLKRTRMSQTVGAAGGKGNVQCCLRSEKNGGNAFLSVQP